MARYKVGGKDIRKIFDDRQQAIAHLEKMRVLKRAGEPIPISAKQPMLSTPILSNFILQRSLTQRELTNREIAQREKLYAEFIRQGTVCYARALSQSLEKIDDVVGMYALVSRIRLFASDNVLEAAEEFVRKLISKYGERNMSIAELETAALEQHMNPLSDFALKCRSELKQIYDRAARGKP